MKVNGEFKGEIAGRKQVEDALHASEVRYRNLFENSPVSLWEEDASEVKAYIDTLRKSGVSDFREYWEKHPETIRECVSLLKILNVNMGAGLCFSCGYYRTKTDRRGAQAQGKF